MNVTGSIGETKGGVLAVVVVVLVWCVCLIVAANTIADLLMTMFSTK